MISSLKQCDPIEEADSEVPPHCSILLHAEGLHRKFAFAANKHLLCAQGDSHRLVLWSRCVSHEEMEP